MTRCEIPLLAILVGLAGPAHAEMIPWYERWDVEFQSLPPDRIFEKLDLARPGFEAVKSAVEKGDRHAALVALREHYRKRFPLDAMPAPAEGGKFNSADRICRHVFQWGPYDAADYGDDIDWAADPAHDIEWVAAVYRFYWANDLTNAYDTSRDDKYVRAFVELTSDWIRKHPLEDWRRTHPVYERWKGFAWLDLQTGIRADNMCRAFVKMVHSDAFTPEFLGVFLASIYDHQIKTETVPRGTVHNKAIFEMRGFVNVAHSFPEFRASRRWMETGLRLSRENLLAQVTEDGVQKEWSGGYHIAVTKDAADIMERAQSAGLDVPDDYRQRVRRMFDYIFAIGTPELGFPMFGDCARDIDPAADRSRWQLYSVLIRGTKLFGEPRYAARARLDRGKLPTQTSYAFRDAGMYVMRSEWGPGQTYFALHCSPKGISGHDQEDNGTFEMYAGGRWLLTDSGYYTYGGDPEARKWHRQTSAHQTLTLDGKNTQISGRCLLWHDLPRLNVLVVENDSYPNLVHRRSVWFVDRTFFVILDEAVGDATGSLDLHFHFAVGDVEVDTAKLRAMTRFEDVNLLVQAAEGSNMSLHEEPGWFAWAYGKRKPRTSIRYRHDSNPPAAFVTLLIPYQGSRPPDASVRFDSDHRIGGQSVELTARIADQTWRLGYDLIKEKGEAEKMSR